jgi:hypothetical protein
MKYLWYNFLNFRSLYFMRYSLWKLGFFTSPEISLKRVILEFLQ